MRDSRRFINFALLCCMLLILPALAACQGRTTENVEPNGDTVEVVIMQDTISEK